MDPMSVVDIRHMGHAGVRVRAATLCLTVAVWTYDAALVVRFLVG